MQENIRENLRLWHSGRGPVTKEATQRSFVILSDDLDQPIVFCETSLGQFDAVFVQDRIEIVRVVAFARQSFQPKPVGQQQMIQRSVEAAEVDASLKAI